MDGDGTECDLARRRGVCQQLQFRRTQGLHFMGASTPENTLAVTMRVVPATQRTKAIEPLASL